jgi:hypothetical protein
MYHRLILTGELAVPELTSAAFLSYSRKDSDFALRLAKDLNAAGARVWLDQIELVPGFPWDDSIENALKDAAQMLVVLTPSSVESPNVKNEIHRALRNGKVIIPVMYQDCSLPLNIERMQYVDFRSEYARGLARLLTHLGVEKPDESVLQMAVDADAQRQVAWRAREADAARLRYEEQRAQEERMRKAQEAGELERRRQGEALATSQATRKTALWVGAGAAVILTFAILGVVLHYRDTKPSTQPPAASSTAGLSQPGSESGVIAPDATPSSPAGQGPATTSAQPSADPAAAWAEGYGLYMAKDYAQALPLFKGACDGGDARGCEALGYMYAYGLGINPDYPQAAGLLRKGCEGGVAEGCDVLGNLYLTGASGVAQSFTQAATWFHKACDGGNPEGCNNLGMMDYLGNGVPPDHAQGRALLQRACSAGYALACNNLNIYPQ